MDGIIVINKPKNCTSHDVVYKVKRIFNEKVGHTGTLDPNATGVLPLLVGQGTKLSKYLIEHDKKYQVVLELGKKTTTADIEGEILQEKDVPENALNKDIIEKVFEKFIGKQKQKPPIYSAIKVKGKKLYEYAREGKEIEIRLREIEIYELKLNSIDKQEKQIVFTVSCSKGTYIRSLCEDIAEKLGTIGYMKELKRTQVGRFRIEEATTLEELSENINNDEYIQKQFIDIEKFFVQNNEKNKKIQLNEKKLSLFLNGVKLSQDLPNGLYRVYNDCNKFIGIGLVKNNLLKREIIVEK